MHNAIVIDSKNQTITYKDLTEAVNSGNTLPILQGLVGGYIDAVTVGNDTLWVNDEGLLVNENFFFSFDGNMLAGNGVITGERNGETIGTKLTLEDIQKRVKFLGLQSTNH